MRSQLVTRIREMFILIWNKRSPKDLRISLCQRQKSAGTNVRETGKQDGPRTRRQHFPMTGRRHYPRTRILHFPMRGRRHYRSTRIQHFSKDRKTLFSKGNENYILQGLPLPPYSAIVQLGEKLARNISI